MRILNPLTLPLNQNALIEASAGTGKTYTITTLYLRALLGLVDDEAVLAPKSIEQILVVTFTEAATQEIRDRVRKKLIEAQHVLLATEFKQYTDIAAELDQQQLSQHPLTISIEQQFDLNTVGLLNTFVGRYLTTQPEGEQDKQQAILYAYHRLQNAITLIDEASIFTIHGFCHRCIKQFAFETNSSFEQHFEMDNKPIIQAALYDFWRKYVVELTGAEFAWFEQNWRTPDSLYKHLGEVLGKPIVISPAINAEDYQQLINDYEAQVVTLKQQWTQSDFTQILLSGNLKQISKMYKRIGVLHDFVLSDNWFPDFVKGDEWSMWGTEALNNAKNYKAKATPIQHSISKTIDTLSDIETALKSGGFQSYWLQQAKQYIEQRAQQIKNERQIINPDDLLSQLLLAINPSNADIQPTIESEDKQSLELNNHSVEENQLLLQAIRHKYPIAFIDEFQDTDPTQYGIFSAIYANAQISQDTVGSQDNFGSNKIANMILIGDPKQAIYKFRGADIFTYIQAKQDLTEQQHYTLSTNWRSHPNLVTAVNGVFKQSLQGFKHKDIPFEAVNAGKSASTQLVSDQIQDNKLMFCHLLPDTQAPDAIGFTSSEAQNLLAKWCASQIKTTLLQAKQGKTYIDNKGVSTPVKAKNICVLVRNRHQASLIKKTLSELNIRSVFISRDNIFKTSLATDLLRLLLAINSPFNERKVRSACATRFFDYSIDELHQLQHDPNLWQQHLDWFYTANQTWSYGQISSAIELILNQADTLSRWQSLSPTEYERLITDQRHLSELLQQQSVKHTGVEKLLHWFEQQVTIDDNWTEATDDQQLRLESDSNLVQIATLHASKGLEYPIVYLPFVCEFKAAKTAIYNSNKLGEAKQKQGLTYRVDNRVLELQQAEGERLAEDLRLLYVAMTRPVFKLVIGMFNLLDQYKRPVIEQTAIGQLLLADILETETPSNELIQQHCERLASETTSPCEHNQAPFQYWSQAADEVSLLFSRDKKAQINFEQQQQSNIVFKPFNGHINDGWKMLSYSALVAGAQHVDSIIPNKSGELSHVEFEVNDVWVAGFSDEQALVNQTPVNDVEPLMSIDAGKLELEVQQNNPFSFPKGANAGTCLHWILENLDFQQPVVEQLDIVEEGLVRHGIEVTWLSVAVSWMQNIIDCNISSTANDWSLSEIKPSQCLIEMEFYFNFNSLSGEVVSNALQMMGLKRVHFAEYLQSTAEQGSSQGIVKGFIDLTVEHQGKYYVIDYKSNHLGDDFAAYKPASLAQSMSDHHYEIQALIYTLALHRWLQTRIADYDYDRDMGGALYLFLRGMQRTDKSVVSEQAEQTGVYTLTIKREVIEYLDNALMANTLAATSISQKSTNVLPDELEQPQSQHQTMNTEETVQSLNDETQADNQAPQMGFNFD